jgi:hypothetical protein
MTYFAPMPFYVIESTSHPWAVTAEVASSSLVVPAIFSRESTNNQGMQVSLRGTNGPVEWLTIAKDGLDLPAQAVNPTKGN